MNPLRYTLTLGLMLGGLAFAQTVVPLPPPEAGAFEHEISISGTPGGDFVYVRAGMGMQKLVKGAPYSAQSVTEFTQTLPDGNRIHHTSTASMVRDSEGRTRREESIGAIGALAASGQAPKSIMIHDPVTGSGYILEVDSHTARVIHERGATLEEGGFKMAMHGEISGDMKTHVRTHQPADVKKEDLGTQVMEGLSVQGKRITKTIPAGQIGNDQPLEIVSESWYSAELQTTVMSKTTDPRSGQTVFRLTNVSRAEPDPALFQLPADYKVATQDEVGHRKVRVMLKEE